MRLTMPQLPDRVIHTIHELGILWIVRFLLSDLQDAVRSPRDTRRVVDDASRVCIFDGLLGAVGVAKDALLWEDKIGFKGFLKGLLHSELFLC